MTILSAHSYRLALVLAGIGLSGGVASAQEGQPSREKASHSKAIAEARGLVAELEEQADRQRSRLRMAEASLRRAKSLLEVLEGAPMDGSRQPRGSQLSPEEERSLRDQADAEKLGWKWDEERTMPQSSMRQVGEAYKLRTATTKGEPWSLTFTLTREGQADYSWEGHERTVFARGGDVLYRADFGPGTSGCAIIAYDLKPGKLLWISFLYGIPSRAHSAYRNRINMEVDGRHLIVYGNESYGRYIELLDPATGKTVGHRLFEPEAH